MESHVLLSNLQPITGKRNGPVIWVFLKVQYSLFEVNIHPCDLKKNKRPISLQVSGFVIFIKYFVDGLSEKEGVRQYFYHFLLYLLVYNVEPKFFPEFDLQGKVQRD